MNRIQRIAVFSTVSTALLAAPVFGQNRDDRRDDHNNQSPTYQNNGAGDHHDQNGDRNNQTYRNDANRNDGDHHDGYVRHDEWKKGYHLRHEDWDRGRRVDDWRAHQLRRPPRGYEWRQLDGNYVLGSINSGVISATIVAR